MERGRPWFRKIVVFTRFVMMIPIVSIFGGAVVLVGVGAYRTATTVGRVLTGSIEEKGALVSFITLADLFLLATVLYVVALGLYSLFVDDDLPLPQWLQVHSLEDLKEKLIGVVVVALAVFFLGQVISGTEPMNGLLLGVGTAATVASLAYFTKGLHKEPENRPSEEDRDSR